MLFLLMVLLPWQARIFLYQAHINGGYTEYGTVALYATEVLLWILAAFFLITRSRQPIRVFAQFAGLVVFLATVVVIGALHVDATTLLFFWKFLEAVLLALLILNVATPEVPLWGLTFGGLLQTVFAVIEFIMRKVPASTFLGTNLRHAEDLGVSVVQIGGQRFLRAYGSFPHPNILGGYLVIVITAFLILWMRSHKIWNPRMRRAAPFIVGTLALGLFLTFSRGAILALIISMSLWYMLSRKEDRRLLGTPLITLTVVLSALGIVFAPFVQSRLSRTTALEQRSIEERRLETHEVETIITKSRWFGVGPWHYVSALTRYVDPNRPSYQYQPVHNVWLLIVAELGVLGFAAFVVWFGKMAFTWYRSHTIIPLVILSQLIVIMCFDHYYWSLFPGMLIFWTSMGLAHRLSRS